MEKEKRIPTYQTTIYSGEKENLNDFLENYLRDENVNKLKFPDLSLGIKDFFSRLVHSEIQHIPTHCHIERQYLLTPSFKTQISDYLSGKNRFKPVTGNSLEDIAENLEMELSKHGLEVDECNLKNKYHLFADTSVSCHKNKDERYLNKTEFKSLRFEIQGDKYNPEYMIFKDYKGVYILKPTEKANRSIKRTSILNVGASKIQLPDKFKIISEKTIPQAIASLKKEIKSYGLEFEYIHFGEDEEMNNSKRLNEKEMNLFKSEMGLHLRNK